METKENEKQLTGYPSIDKPWLKYYSEEAINAPLPECTIYENIYKSNETYANDIALMYFWKKLHIRHCLKKLIKLNVNLGKRY